MCLHASDIDRPDEPDVLDLNAKWAFDVQDYLRLRGYTPFTRCRIVHHLRMFASAECCPDLSTSDRDAVERLLPESEWPAWTDAERWTTAEVLEPSILEAIA